MDDFYWSSASLYALDIYFLRGRVKIPAGGESPRVHSVDRSSEILVPTVKVRMREGTRSRMPPKSDFDVLRGFLFAWDGGNEYD